jgi:hypothetical protein
MKKSIFIAAIFMIGSLFGALTVISPNGNEPLKRGEEFDIRWVDNIAEKVKIELFKNEIFYSTIADSTESDSLYSWIVPNDVAGKNFRIKISSVLDSVLNYDSSDRFFEILPGVVANVTPAVHLVLSRGSTYEITWVDDIEEDVKIELYQNGNFVEEITSSTPSIGLFSGSLPLAFNGINYKIKVSSTVLPDLVYAWSEGGFDVMSDYIKKVSPYVNYVIPKGNGGQEYIINWEMSDWNYIDFGNEIKIELYQDSDLKELVKDWGQWKKTDDDKRGFGYSYFFPPWLTGSGYKFKVTARIFTDEGFDPYRYISAWSEGEISIMSDYVKKVSPYVNEVITRGNGGQEYVINWEMNDFNFAEYKVELFQNGNFKDLVTDWYWTKDKDPKLEHGCVYYFPFEFTGGGYKFKVSSRIYNGYNFSVISAWSESDISIKTDCISDISPKHGDILFSGSDALITWNDDVEENVKIELFQYGYPRSVISESTGSSGLFLWSIPYDLYGEYFKIKVSSLILPDRVYSVSEGNFKITQSLIDLTNLNHGQAIPRNNDVEIEWQDCLTENVKLELYQNGTYHSDIAGSTISSGSYIWTLPTDFTAQNLQIKISSVIDPMICDMSDNYFSIVSDGVILTSMTGGISARRQ